ncbi:UDP-N-acetylglucosamine 2-epimerase [Jeongeupia naejangsanensis]|uniref:UDP-N-acetylglucosamine 2-epimerase (Hydrolyzing) n=1 Tax=Jeongeupia naejangsanensis TaxID=613195 RepID=A0ABS2BP40_9NEIS|nr:UDP-N-acetylglucosamine 2-epimerase [Jeongeupia naejangsanensis]MBM3117397.1 UDP-N-acetylglucosamine 2-epimerase (hydrolyzing) [Jeongeupia naejangsanensis]
MVRRICVVTATRAEYGLLRPLIAALQADGTVSLQLVVTGAHLAPEFGQTWKQIEADGFVIDAKVEMLLAGDTATATAKSMGLALSGFADVFARLQPELLVMLGDRYEMLAVAAAATLFRIPIAHLHGGETTEGAYDEAFRHAITKFAHLHFTATEDYRCRVIQLGEDPERVFNVGAIGIDSIKTLPLFSREQLLPQLGLIEDLPYWLVTYHPVTLAEGDAVAEVDALVEALLAQAGTRIVVTGANADAGGRAVNARWQYWQAQYPHRLVLFASLGSLRYLSAAKHAIAVVGNSSSGIIEAPSLGVPTLDIGSRQQGRVRAGSVHHVAPTANGIAAGLVHVARESARHAAASHANPYGDGGTTDSIMAVLSETDFASLLVKHFHDLPRV